MQPGHHDGSEEAKKSREREKGFASAGDHAAAQTERARQRQRDMEWARQVLDARKKGSNKQTTADALALLELGKRLKEYCEMGDARRVLMLACEIVSTEPASYPEIFQQAALCTYKDPDLPLDWKLDRACEILETPQSLAETRDPETLGIAGAIAKRKWEVDGRREHLERALYYYLKGYAQSAPEAARGDVIAYLVGNPGCVFDARKSRGYQGINAAFVLDLLAAQEAEEACHVGISARGPSQRREQARLIRAEITRSVPPVREQTEWLKFEWWYYATIGEAFFGLGDYEQAEQWLIAEPISAGLRVGFGRRSSAGLEVAEWEYESTARQLASLGRLTEQARRGDGRSLTEAEFEASEPGRALAKFLGGEHKAVASAFRGKFGLGLSGGGFRASLFHIGVLARLAELDVLRHVEVLSCVSGGSIIGAHYYLELRKLLMRKSDQQIREKDYVEIVERIERDFLEGVQRNIRTRVLAELSTNLKMLFSRRYSRTLRVGELYERELFSKVHDAKDGQGPITGPTWLPDPFARLLGYRREPRLLKDLRIIPAPDTPDAPVDEDFSPKRDNWRRKNKVPALILNACSLNSGHNWQFTASYMGEPPLPIQTDIDCNFRLRRFYFQDAPSRARSVTLGAAVAASSCVPGLFEPLILDGLYDSALGRPISVRLVDGGVCDNQGISSLLEQDCKVLLVSDGSGQMDAQETPSAGVVGVLGRSNSVLQARVREAQYNDIASRQRGRLLSGLMFVHLKQGLAGRSLPWRNCPPMRQESDVYEGKFDVHAEATGVTSYGVRRDIQGKLAAIRTDLDSFSEAEASALMASGYRMVKEHFEKNNPLPGLTRPVAGTWRFRAIEPALEGDQHSEALRQLLEVSSNTTFKVWRLSAPLAALKWLLALIAVVSLLAWFVSRWDRPLVTEFLPPSVRGLTVADLGKGAAVMVGVALLTALLNALLGKKNGEWALRAIRWRDTVQNVAIGLGMSVAGWLVARVHLHVFDGRYLRYGRLAHFSSPAKEVAEAELSEAPEPR